MKKKLTMLILLVVLTFVSACVPEETDKVCRHRYEYGICTKCNAERTITDKCVLFIGNSYTYYNDHLLAVAFTALAAEARYNVTVDEISNGSAMLSYYLPNGQYASQFDGMMNNKYDYVFLQDHSTFPVNGKVKFVESVVAIQSILTEIQSKSTTIMYMTWARKTGNSWLTDNKMTAAEMESKLYDSYSAAAGSINALLSPVGIAFGLMRDKDVEMYAEDESHPSLAGSYLAALVHFSIVFNENPLNAKYVPDSIDSATALKLKTAAYNAVNGVK